MNAKLNNRLASLEDALNPKQGIADSIRQANRERLAGSDTRIAEVGRIAADILKTRAVRELKGK
jgi:hypothetical protein